MCFNSRCTLCLEDILKIISVIIEKDLTTQIIYNFAILIQRFLNYYNLVGFLFDRVVSVCTRTD
jgi:hypothetical protein